MNIWPWRRRVTAGALGALLLIAGDVSGGRENEARALLDRLNQTWRGADAVIRIPVQIKKKRDRDGWSQSLWIVYQGADKKDGFVFRLRVSDRDRIRHLMDGDILRPGTRFVADGWGFEQPDRAKGLYLDLRFADAPVRARWLFTAAAMTTRSNISPDELSGIERYMRIQAYQVRPPQEQLVQVATPTPAAARIPVAPPTPRPAPSLEVFRPALRMAVVAVQPARARAGDEVRLIVTYEVGGLPPGSQFEVTETRRLMAGERVLTTFQDRVARATGSFTSELPVRVPAGLQPGLYSLQAVVELAGVTADGSAYFQVDAQDTGGNP